MIGKEATIDHFLFDGPGRVCAVLRQPRHQQRRHGGCPLRRVSTAKDVILLIPPQCTSVVWIDLLCTSLLSIICLL